MKKIENIRIPAREKLTLISNLSTMITAGIPILNAVHSISENKKGNVKEILNVINDDLLKGNQLYKALAKFPRVFDKVTVNLIRAAEETGTLDIALRDLKEEIKKEIELTKKVRSAMIYPLLVVVVALLVLFFILTIVIPKIALIFTQLRLTLPLPTKIMIFLSDLLLHKTIFVVLGIALITGGLVLFYKKKKETVFAFLYRLPFVSTLIREIDLLRFTRSLHILLNAGVPITTALDLTHDIVINKELNEAINHVKETVLTGRPMSIALKERPKMFPETMITLVEAGEKTGTLSNSLRDIADYFEERTSEAIKTLTTVLEPLLLVVVGIIVAGLMLAIIGPIYGLIGNISPK